MVERRHSKLGQTRVKTILCDSSWHRYFEVCLQSKVETRNHLKNGAKPKSHTS